jgi:hypothetical protein
MKAWREFIKQNQVAKMTRITLEVASHEGVKEGRKMT